MPVKLNTEFNYRYQVEGNTPWEQIKTLQGFLEGRIRAAALEEVSNKKFQALQCELNHVKANSGLPHVVLRLEAELLEAESHRITQAEAFDLNRQEIKIIEKVLAELYEVAEPTRIPGYTDEQMFEANAANEFAVMIMREIQAEIIAHGHPSPAKIRNALSNPTSTLALRALGIVPDETKLLTLDTINTMCIEHQANLQLSQDKE